jgi:hypothetical protein
VISDIEAFKVLRKKKPASMLAFSFDFYRARNQGEGMRVVQQYC